MTAFQQVFSIFSAPAVRIKMFSMSLIYALLPVQMRNVSLSTHMFSRMGEQSRQAVPRCVPGCVSVLSDLLNVNLRKPRAVQKMVFPRCRFEIFCDSTAVNVLKTTVMLSAGIPATLLPVAKDEPSHVYGNRRRRPAAGMMRSPLSPIRKKAELAFFSDFTGGSRDLIPVPEINRRIAPRLPKNGRIARPYRRYAAR
jgi:hypothetical protein